MMNREPTIARQAELLMNIADQIAYRPGSVNAAASIDCRPLPPKQPHPAFGIKGIERSVRPDPDSKYVELVLPVGILY